jgi:hypothetical protein
MWDFPESLKDGIAFHHEPEKAPQNSKLVHLTYLADLLMARFNTGLELERMGGGSLEDRIGRLDIHSDDIPAIVDLIPQALFYAGTETTPSG